MAVNWNAFEAKPAREALHELPQRVRAALEECLAGLHEHSARLIREFYFEGRTAREISEAIGKKEVSVWVTIMRIRRALRACISARVTSVKAASGSPDSA